MAFSCQSCMSTSKGTPANCVGRFCHIKRQAVFAMRWIGRGQCKICGALNIPHPMSNFAYTDHCKALHKASEEVAEASMTSAAKDVRSFNEEGEEGEVSNTLVSFDGTWMKQGFSSKFGVGCRKGHRLQCVIKILPSVCYQQQQTSKGRADQ